MNKLSKESKELLEQKISEWLEDENAQADLGDTKLDAKLLSQSVESVIIATSMINAGL